MGPAEHTILFGSYPQAGLSLRPEPIEWVILEQQGHKCLCVSKFLLDCKPYHTQDSPVTWEGCYLRQWLNRDFLSSAFTEEEQTRIVCSELETLMSRTQDRIFLLHSQEAEALLSEDAARIAKVTPYAKSQGAWSFEDYGVWWLRDWYESSRAQSINCVNFDGYIETAASEATSPVCGVRPALWLTCP
ncbi:MAG TPA: hypothetical protein H9841_09005, partial [Candidatus Flavonifractor merdigallinarum]|nr:hypothetical protein [Candidatus Flavonifractor merdigallinarum]